MRSLPSVLLTAALLAGCGGAAGTAAAPQAGPTPAPPAGTPGPVTPAPVTPAPVTPAPVTPTAAPEPSSAGTATRTVYWLGAAEDPRGPRLYRELLPAPDTGDAVRDAVARMLEGSPADPDYDSLWADGTRLLSVQREGTTAVVDLSSEASTNGGGSAFEAMTVQQLVHTVTAAEPSLQAVQLRVAGQPVETLWGAVDVRQPVRRSPAAETLGPVWLDVPEGGAVDGTFGGSATVFEATVSWQLRRGEEVVEEGFATATTGAPERGEWTATVAAPAGDYDLWAFESSAKDGAITWVDSKRVTLR